MIFFPLLFASAILDLLNIDSSEQSRDYVTNQKEFQLHNLLTEQRHPKTWDLSQKIQGDTRAGIEALLSVDVDISEKMLALSENTALLDKAVRSVKTAILENGRIYIYGCGATGRLAKQMESSFWRPFWKKMQALPAWEKVKPHFPNIENRLIGEMTGADRALISSLEGLEDLQLIGKLQLEDHGIGAADVVFAITEGGETSSVIGTVLAAANRNCASYFIYNNPNSVLLPFERSRRVIENDAITKICLATGPQSITGSTRMQATTSETFVMGLILEQALYELLQPYLAVEEMEDLGFHAATMKERLLSFIPLQKAVYETRDAISQLTDLESATYEDKAFSTYFAQNALITVFIDSTERAPTFRLFPLDICDAAQRKSWIQVWTPAEDKLQAWQNFLGRPFYGLDRELYEKPFSEKIENAYLKAAALRSLKNAGNEQQFLYDFSYSQANIEAHGPKENDLGVMVLFEEEIAQLNNSLSSFQGWLKTFVERKAKTALIALPSAPISLVHSIAPEILVLQLPVDGSGDPLRLRQHVALKMLLNAHSTGVMAKLGRVVGNTMTHVNPSNLKLIGRATFLILSHVNDKLPLQEKISYAEANEVLFNAIEYGKKTGKTGQSSEVALSIIRILEAVRKNSFVSWKEAETILESQGLEKYLPGAV
jgi:N-acetylmuramic acid 6-phosphate (MurNAc-6-P) etherase